MKLEVILFSVLVGISSDLYMFGIVVGCLYILLYLVVYLGYYDEMYVLFFWKLIVEYLEFELSCVMKIVRIV